MSISEKLHLKLMQAVKSIGEFPNYKQSHLISQPLVEHLAEEGYVFGAEYRNEVLANDGTQFIQIEATTKPVTFIFGAGVEALHYVDSFFDSTLTTPTTMTPFNYKPSSTEVATAIVRHATAASVLGTPRGNNQIGSGNNPSSGVGGSVTSRPTTLAPGEKITLRLTNKGGGTKSTSVAVYWSEVQVD